MPTEGMSHPSKGKQMRAGKTLVAIGSAVALVFVIACSGAGDTGKEENTNAGPQPAATSATAVAAGPVTSFADGVYDVGTGAGQVPAGKYKTTVPANAIGCYWERLSGTGGTFDEIIANGNGTKGAPLTVTIAATDKAFKTERCGTWSPAA